jgi:hypothetical protein
MIPAPGVDSLQIPSIHMKETFFSFTPSKKMLGINYYLSVMHESREAIHTHKKLSNIVEKVPKYQVS